MTGKKHLVEPDPSKDQHFMVNRRTVERIVELASLSSGDTVLEIGAGTGILTERLARTKARVIAVEIDRRFAKVLGELGYKNLEIVYANALDVIDGMEFSKIVSNIPYSICEPLIGKLAGKSFELAVLSVPENFCRIISAEPGEKEYSLLSLKAGVFFSVKPAFRIPAEDFHPLPPTASFAIVLAPLTLKDYAASPAKFVFRELFIQKEKKLKNALMEALINLNVRLRGKRFTKKTSLEAIAKMEIAEALLQKRVDKMSTSEFAALGRKFRPFL
jgi:16S rRNA (adenine1518-N6/adenine1519-N6)-dimethyltransferase